MRSLTRAGTALAAALLVWLPAVPALGQTGPPAQTALADRQERDVVAAEGKGTVPVYRKDGTTLLVCGTDQDDINNRVASYPTDQRVTTLSLWSQCQTGGFRTLQDAVAAVKLPGTTIKILPGVYTDKPPAQPAAAGGSTACVGLPAVLTYDQQSTCPTTQNMAGVIGKQDLQIEGAGVKPEDVVLDAGFAKPYGIRVDRSPGTYLRNLTVQHTTASAVYVLESDGFALDDVTARWNDEYGLRMIASDHGLASECDAYGNGTAGIAVSATPNVSARDQFTTQRFPVEIRRCDSSQNLVGFAASAGDSVWVHESLLAGNSVGVATDSLSPHLPGNPQNHAVFEGNEIGSNNRNYYNFVRDGTCAKPSAQRGYDQGVVCPTRGLPAGTGVVNLGGNYDTWQNNWVYDNSYAGFVMGWAPAYFRGATLVGDQFDNAHHDRVFDNKLGVRPSGEAAPNGIDVWWDGQGVGSCFQGPSAGSVPRVLPHCNPGGLPSGLATARYLPEPGQALALYVCTRYDMAAKRIPSDCSWYGASGLGLIQNKVALGGAILIGLFLVIGWWRLARGSGVAFAGTTLALAGLVVGVYGSLRPTSVLTGLGLLLLGFGYLAFGAGLRGKRHGALGLLTMGMALFALLGAVDHLVFALPWLPVPPSVARVLLELIWLPSVVVAATAHVAPDAVDEYLPARRGRPHLPRRRPRVPRDPLERFAAALRDP